MPLSSPPAPRVSSDRVFMVLASDPFRVRLSALPTVAPEHIEALARLQWLGLPRIVRQRVTIEEEQRPASAIFIVRRGWVFASKLLRNGGRQVVDFFVPGDVIGGARA